MVKHISSNGVQNNCSDALLNMEMKFPGCSLLNANWVFLKFYFLQNTVTSFVVKAIKAEKRVLLTDESTLCSNKLDSSPLQVHQEITRAGKKGNWIERNCTCKFKIKREKSPLSHKTSKGVLSDDLPGFFRQILENIRQNFRFLADLRFLRCPINFTLFVENI